MIFLDFNCGSAARCHVFFKIVGHWIGYLILLTGKERSNPKISSIFMLFKKALYNDRKVPNIRSFVYSYLTYLNDMLSKTINIYCQSTKYFPFTQEIILSSHFLT